MEKTKVIGIVGGGQLAMMMTEAAIKLGFDVIVVDPNPNCSAHQAGAEQIVADYKDATAIEKLASKSDVVTIDFEHVNTDILAQLATNGHEVEPSPATVKMIQDKYEQCVFLQQHGLPVAPFIRVDSEKDAKAALEKFGGSMLLKKRFTSYDGKGNALVKNQQDLLDALENFGSQDLYAEQVIDFVKELSVIIARDTRGTVGIYPVVETIHVNNICHEVFMPAPIDADVSQGAKELGMAAAKVLDGAGVFAIEMFLDDSGKLYINEIAPRVHNSGHLTIEACETSQFEQHIRAITGMELSSTAPKVPAAVMINILGTRSGVGEPKGVDVAEQIDGTFVHLYGKTESRIGRKMGHITATADTLEEAKHNAEAAHKLITI